MDFIDPAGDDSGVFLQYTEQEQPKAAGILLLGTSGSAPPRTTTFFETSCEIQDSRTIHPFAFRTHTHSLGKVCLYTYCINTCCLVLNFLYNCNHCTRPAYRWCPAGGCRTSRSGSLSVTTATSLLHCIELNRAAGKKDPQLPQMFYPVADPSLTLTRGDTVAARCTMVNHRDRYTMRYLLPTGSG